MKYFVQNKREDEWSFFLEMVGANLGKWVSEENDEWKTKMAESKMVEFKLAEFKMAAIIKLGENEWVWVRLN